MGVYKKMILSFFFTQNIICSELPFVVVIPAYNVESYCERNLASVFGQNYSNYRVIYVEDCSTDKTRALVKDCIKNNNQERRVIMVENDCRMGSLANIYKAVHMCLPNEIVIDLDGDDYLAHNNVFQQINQAYQSTGAWVIYSQYKTTKGKVGLCEKIPEKVIKENSFRKYKWVSSHVRTFYAKLFNAIKKEDLLFNGTFYQAGGDQAFMFAILEMAGKHIYYLDEILYLYNVDNPLNDLKVNLKKAKEAETHISGKTPYKSLTDQEFALL